MILSSCLPCSGVCVFFCERFSVRSSKPLEAACSSLQRLSHLSAYVQLNLCFPGLSVKTETLELPWPL